jgi:uncharacterized membrane protein YkgB
MKICKSTCLISIMFIVGNIIFSILMKNSNVKNQASKKIVEERQKLAIQGYIAGIIVGLLLVALKIYIFKNLSKTEGFCIMVASTFVVQYFYYILMPKSDYMIVHLDTKEEREQWIKTYRTYQFNYHLSIFIGIVGAGLLGLSLKC